MTEDDDFDDQNMLEFYWKTEDNGLMKDNETVSINLEPNEDFVQEEIYSEQNKEGIDEIGRKSQREEIFPQMVKNNSLKEEVKSERRYPLRKNRWDPTRQATLVEIKEKMEPKSYKEAIEMEDGEHSWASIEILASKYVQVSFLELASKCRLSK